MATSFSMDTIGFLQAINKLERRFEELVSPETMRKVCEDYDRDGTPTTWDHRLYALARDVFACGSWTTNLCAAAMSFNGRLVGECRRFLHGCSETVRKYGISVWLYELLNDSTLALFRDDPSDYMPSLIRMTTVEELMRRPRGRKRFGNRKQRGLAMEEHSTQMHRLAAYTLLNWGADERRSLDIARMLLLYPGIGMCMLREDGDVLRFGAAPDMRYRRVVDYLHERRAQADAEYELHGNQWMSEYMGRHDDEEPAAGEIATADRDAGGCSSKRDGVRGYAEVGDESLCDCESCARIDMEDRLDLLKCERRYMYDVVRLIDAYEKMWDDEPIDVDDRMFALEHNRDVPGEPLWQDVVFLNDLAYSLMGDVMAHDLILGFERRDRKRFDRGVEQLELLTETLVRFGLLSLPIIAFMNGFDEFSRGLDDDYATDGTLYSTSDADIQRLTRRMQKRLDKLSEEEMNAKAHLGESLANIVLARFPDERLARGCALALFRGNPDQYDEVVESMLMRPDDDPGDMGPGDGDDAPLGDVPNDDVLRKLDFDVEELDDDLELAMTVDL